MISPVLWRQSDDPLAVEIVTVTLRVERRTYQTSRLKISILFLSRMVVIAKFSLMSRIRTSFQEKI